MMILTSSWILIHRLITQISKPMKSFTKCMNHLTGHFPYRSSWGNEYILVAYHYDGNGILVEPLKNCNAKSIVNTWEIINK